MKKVMKMILKKHGKEDKGKLKIDYNFVEHFLMDLGELNINLMIIHSKLGKLPLQGGLDGGQWWWTKGKEE